LNLIIMRGPDTLWYRVAATIGMAMLAFSGWASVTRLLSTPS
jgi:hypothetical protein